METNVGVNLLQNPLDVDGAGILPLLRLFLHLLRALKKGLEDGVFKKAKETGKGSGSYKIVKNKKKPAAKKAKPSTKSMAVTKESGNTSGNA